MNGVLAVVRLRHRLMLNRLRKGEGLWNLAGGILLGLLWGVAAVGGAVAAGVLMKGALDQGDEPLLFKLQLGVLLVAFAAGVFLPLLIEKDQSGPVTGRLLAFPVTPRQLFWMSQAALAGSADHLFYYPLLIAAGLVVVAGPGPVWLGLTILLSLWLCILAWAHAVGLGIEAMLRGRRSREILGVATILVILTLGMGPGIVEEFLDGRDPAEVPALQSALRVVAGAGRMLAPSQAAAGLQAVRQADTARIGTALLGIWAWTVPGLLLAGWVFTAFYLGDKGRLRRGAGRARPLRRAGAAAPPWELRLPDRLIRPAVLAVAVKELRIILRSLSGRLMLVLAPLLMGFIGWSVLRDITQAFLGLQAGEIRFFGMLLYVSLFANSQTANSLAFEGSGVQSYFLLPVGLSQVIMGKNLGLWLYQGLLLGVCLISLAVVGSFPGPVPLIGGILMYGGVIVFRTTVGNALSFLFPSPRRLSSRKDRTSAMSNLISFLGFAVYGAVVWFFAVMPTVAGRPRLQPAALGLLLVLTLVAHRISLGPVAALLLDRRERIVTALRSRED